LSAAPPAKPATFVEVYRGGPKVIADPDRPPTTLQELDGLPMYARLVAEDRD
jgi:hypothetical protein